MSTKIKIRKDSMVSGGKRPGAGRKKGEPTKQVRIPVRGAAVARDLVDHYLNKAQEKLERSTWYQDCSEDKRENIKIALVEVTEKEWRTGLDETWESLPTLIAIAEDETTGEHLDITIILS